MHLILHMRESLIFAYVAQSHGERELVECGASVLNIGRFFDKSADISVLGRNRFDFHIFFDFSFLPDFCRNIGRNRRYRPINQP